MFSIEHLENISHFSSLMIDGQSIASINQPDDLYQKPSYNKKNFSDIMGNISTDNLITNLIIYDNIYYDASLLFGNEKTEIISNIFNGIIKPLFIPLSIKNEISKDLSLYSLREDDFNIQKYSKIVTNQWSVHNNDCEKIEYDEIVEFRRNLYSSANTLYENMKKYVTKYNISFSELKDIIIIPSYLRDSSKSFFRTHFNMELANAISLPLSPHPVRAEYYDEILHVYNDSIAAKIITEVELKYKDYVANNALYYGLDIPPMSDIVYFNCLKKDSCIIDEIFELRNSKSAKSFRSLTSGLMEMMDTPNDKNINTEIQKLIKEINVLTNLWNEDMDLNIKYKKTKINIGKIPLLGWILSIFEDYSSISVNDPLLYHKRPYTIFLNKIYRERAQMPNYFR